MERVHWQKVDGTGDPYIHLDLADRILDRESLLSAIPRKFTICVGWLDLDLKHYSDQHTSPQYAKLFYQKRGV